MEALDYWRLWDELTAVQAALLVTGCDPSSDAEYIEKWAPERRPPGYQAAKTAISNALCRKAIPGRIVPLYADDIDCYAPRRAKACFGDLPLTANSFSMTENQTRLGLKRLPKWRIGS
jgi:hypothetical protein